jgi:hypothetical protein
MKSNKGPWEMFELVKPFGCRRKGSQPALEEIKEAETIQKCEDAALPNVVEESKGPEVI